MKRLLTLSIALIMLFSLTACQSAHTALADHTEAPSTEAPAEDTPEPTAEPTEEPTEAPTPEPTEDPEAVEAAQIEAAWAVAAKMEQVHEQQFDKAGAEVRGTADSAQVRFPSVTYPDEVLCVTVEKDENGYKAASDSVYVALADGASDDFNARFDAASIDEMLEEFRSAEIRVTLDEVRASGCEAEIGSDEYNAAAAAIYGGKLAEYYRAVLTEDSPFFCYDVCYVGTETDEDYEDEYTVLIGFRVRDMLPFSYLFDFVPFYHSGALYPDYEGWLVGWTLVNVRPEADGSFVCDAVLNGAA